VSEQKPQILIVEDDLDLAEMLNSYFRVQGYEVLTAAWGHDAVRISTESLPNLVVLDIRLPDIDGYEVCRQIRNNRRTANIPVIFLTEKRDRVDKLAGLELGVVDYITKPFDIQELRLRVRNALNRSRQANRFNPITNIPEEALSDDHLESLLTSDRKWSVIYLYLGGLDHFRENYGFVASDDVLRAITMMLTNAVGEAGNPDDFIGHFNGHHFIIITDTAREKIILERIETRLHRSLAYFYPVDDRERISEIPQDQRLRLVIGVARQHETEATTLDELKKAILHVPESVIH
jgi:PleD family two-component response regulator